MKRALLHFWKFFAVIFFVYPVCIEGFSINMKAIEVYNALFSFISIVWLRYCIEVLVFVLFIASIAYNIKIVIDKDKEKNGYINAEEN